MSEPKLLTAEILADGSIRWEPVGLTYVEILGMCEAITSITRFNLLRETDRMEREAQQPPPSKPARKSKKR